MPLNIKGLADAVRKSAAIAPHPELILTTARREVCAACDAQEVTTQERDAFYAYCDAIGSLPCRGAEIPEFNQPVKG